MASVGAELWVAGKPCVLGSLSAFPPPESRKQRASRWSLTALPVSLRNGEANSAHAFHGISFPPAPPGSIPVWKQDVKEKLTALDNLIAQPLAPATGSMEQQRLRR